MLADLHVRSPKHVESGVADYCTSGSYDNGK